jgi:hypothetical protein
VRGPSGNTCFQAVKIPTAALEESPNLKKILDPYSDGKWPAWKRVTFSGDRYSQNKRGSLEFAKYELKAFCGAVHWGVPINHAQARAISLRLFDLMRFYRDEPEILTVQQLVELF